MLTLIKDGRVGLTFIRWLGASGLGLALRGLKSWVNLSSWKLAVLWINLGFCVAGSSGSVGMDGACCLGMETGAGKEGALDDAD